MVFKKLKEIAAERRDPFSARKFKGLTPQEQERALTKIATREAEIIEAKESREKTKLSKRIGGVIAPGIKRLEKREGVTGIRARIIASEEKRRRVKVEARKVPLRKRVRGTFAAPKFITFPKISQQTRQLQTETLKGAPQRAQETLKEKINRANLGSAPKNIKGTPSKLKAPPKLI